MILSFMKPRITGSKQQESTKLKENVMNVSPNSELRLISLNSNSKS